MKSINKTQTIKSLIKYDIPPTIISPIELTKLSNFGAAVHSL